jgi:organic hydroperoxide reductase OsmC/OhrA
LRKTRSPRGASLLSGFRVAADVTTNRLDEAQCMRKELVMNVYSMRYPVNVFWQRGRITRASAFDKPDLRVATPPEFRGGMPGVWSPEELLVAATATCFSLTMTAVAEKMQVPLLRLEVTGVGQLGTRDDGRFGFTEIELDVHVEAATVHGAERAEEAALIAEERCVVAMTLDVPVRVKIDARGASVLVTDRRAS